MAAFTASCQSAAVWCASNNINESSFWYWKKKLASIKEPVRFSTKWLSLTVEPDKQNEETKNSLLVRVGHATIEIKSGYDQTLLTDVVRTLQTLLCSMFILLSMCT